MHCENIDHVANELIEDYSILSGNFDIVQEYKKANLRVPSFWDIGSFYMDLILRLEADTIDTLN